MAKVDGPLFSLEARGKIADAMVFFPWKGRHIVREWLKPTQPNSTLQGYVRAALYAIGKEISKIFTLADGDAENSKLYTLNTAAAPAGMNWNAFHAQGVLALFRSAGAFVTGSFTNMIGEFSSLTAAVLTAFKTNATALGMSDFAFNYGYTTNIEAGCQLYFGAKAAWNNSITAGAPFNTNPVSWVATDVNNFKSAHTTA